MRSEVARKQFKCVLPDDVLRHLQAEFGRTGWEKQLQMLAGLVGLACLNEPMRLTMIRWAVAINKGDVHWDDLLDTVRKRRGEALDQRTLLKALDALAALAEPKAAKQRRG